MKDETFVQEILQRLSAMEAHMSVLLPDREKLQDALFELERDVIEAQKDADLIRDEIKQINKRINMFIGALGSLLAAVAGAVLSFLFGR